MLKSILDQTRVFLNQPYPECKGVLNYLFGSMTIGVFIGLFLYIFEPFGMYQAGAFKAWYCFMFGLITFIVSFGSDLFIRFVLKLHRDSEDWVFWKWMISVMVVVLLIAISNFLFMWWQSRNDFSLQAFLGMLGATCLIGIFPVFFTGMLKSRQAYKKNQLLADSLNTRLGSKNPVNLSDWNKSKSYDLDPADILYIEAMQNYVVIHYLADDRKEQKIIRNTLAAIENQLQETQVERTHRSYLVNRNRINSISGNAQGLKLQLEGLDQKEIPVSRKYLKYFQ